MGTTTDMVSVVPSKVPGSKINLAEFGLNGDINQDATEGLKAAISRLRNVSDNGYIGAIEVNSGRYRITEEINFGNLRSFGFCGTASANQFTNWQPTTFPERDSRFVWDGPAGGTMMNFNGSNMQMRNISLWGRDRGATTRAGVLFKIVSVPGIGAGKSLFDNVSFVQSDTLFQTGEVVGGSNNNDYLTFNKCLWRDAINGFNPKNNQSVLHNFYGNQIDYMENFWHIEGGGIVSADATWATGVQNILRLVTNGTLIGQNTSEFQLGNMWIEHSSTGGIGTPQILRCDDSDASGNRRVKINSIRNGGFLQQNDGMPLFIVGGDTDLIVENFNHMRADRPILEINGGTRMARALFQECELSNASAAVWNSTAPFVNSTGPNTRWGFKNCTKAFAQGHLMDIGGWEDLTNSGSGLPGVAIPHGFYREPVVQITPKENNRLSVSANATDFTVTSEDPGLPGSGEFFWTAHLTE